jgi:hypothetical protein
MNDHTQHAENLASLKAAISWLSAILGIGTFAGFVSVAVGCLSGAWLAYQLWVAIKYDLPVKRAKLEAARRGQLDSTRGDL